MSWMSIDAALPIIFMLMGVRWFDGGGRDLRRLGPRCGLLVHRAPDAKKEVLVASISPCWDANETWIVLGHGNVLMALPCLSTLPTDARIQAPRADGVASATGR